MLIEDFGAELKRQGIRDGAGVPCSYFTPLVNYMTVDPELAYVSAASEGEAVAIAAGLTTAGKRAFALMQNSGLGNAVNPITSMLYIYQMPVTLLISHRGQPGLPDEPQHALMGQITEQLAQLCGLETHVLDPARYADQLQRAQAAERPLAFVCRKGTLEGGPKAPPLDLTFHSRQITPAQPGAYRAQLTREQALRALLPALNGEQTNKPAVIATTGKLSRELYELDDRSFERHNRFYMVGSMGCALGFGLGVAQAQAERPVIVLDGDGALLMKLGTVATVGSVQPRNLHHLVFDNGAHDSTGGQPTPSPAVDFAALSLAAGYQMAETVAEEHALELALTRHLSTPGPTMLRVIIHTGSRKDLGRPSLSPRDAYLRFRAFLAGETWAGPQQESHV